MTLPMASSCSPSALYQEMAIALPPFGHPFISSPMDYSVPAI